MEFNSLNLRIGLYKANAEIQGIVYPWYMSHPNTGNLRIELYKANAEIKELPISSPRYYVQSVDRVAYQYLNMADLHARVAKESMGTLKEMMVVIYTFVVFRLLNRRRIHINHNPGDVI